MRASKGRLQLFSAIGPHSIELWCVCVCRERKQEKKRASERAIRELHQKFVIRPSEILNIQIFRVEFQNCSAGSFSGIGKIQSS